MGGLGAPELLIILLVVLVIFGGAKLPKLARSLGQAKNEFEAGQRESQTPAASQMATPQIPQMPETPSDTVTMSKADLEALLAEKARQQQNPPA